MRAAASTLTVIGSVLWLTASSACALGFGRVSNATQLGQPLNFAAAVRLDTDEVLTGECVSAEVVAGDRKLLPGQIRVTLEGGAKARERSVRVTTNALIDEPVVSVSVTLGCTVKVTRRFVAFIDPPLIRFAQTAPMEAPPPPQRQRNDAQVAPIGAVVQGDKPASRTTAPSNRTASASTRTRARPSVVAGGAAAARVETAPPKPASPRRAAAVARQPQIARPAEPGPRLQLEATSPLAARAASATAAASPIATVAAFTTATPVADAAASASKPDQVAELLALERQRNQVLEEGLAKVRAEAQATQQSLASVQARLKAAETQRDGSPLVYGLAWLSALLALAVAGLWWRQSRSRGSAPWWAAPTPAQVPAAESSPQSASGTVASAAVPFGAQAAAADAFAKASAEIDANDRQAAVAESSRRSATESRELSVEELIDLEQQAEFFVALGQDDAAIELLMSHVRSDAGDSPLPYLKLLEIHRRRGDGEAYRHIRERFNRRFNSYAPDWDSDLQQGRALVDYPDTIARLQGLWASPARVMETLDASLFRRNKTDATFDLPAYRELLLLYSIARDLADYGDAPATGDVDLLLPLNAAPIERLVATAARGAVQPADMPGRTTDRDVSFGPPAVHRGAETGPPTLRRPVDRPIQTGPVAVDVDLTAPLSSNPRGAAGKR